MLLKILPSLDDINIKKYLVCFLLLIGLVILYVFISSPMVITVAGVGEVSSPAQSATLTFNLVSNSDNATNVANDLKDKIVKIKESLKTIGIPENDIYESQIAVYPTSSITAGASGFQAMVSMGIKTTQIFNLDAITLTLYSIGANVVTQPVLEVGDKDKLNSQVYDLALKDAKKQALKIALKNFKLIKKIILIQETTTPTTSTVTSKPSTVTQIEDNISPEAGLIKITKVLNVSYKLW